MPYNFKQAGKKVKIIKKATGKVVAEAKNMANAKGFAFHASKGDKK